MDNRIFYFITGPVPTNAEFAKASRFMNKGPLFEFVSLATLDHSAPPVGNRGVAGAVPESYKAFPVLDKAEKVEVFVTTLAKVKPEENDK